MAELALVPTLCFRLSAAPWTNGFTSSQPLFANTSLLNDSVSDSLSSVVACSSTWPGPSLGFFFLLYDAKDVGGEEVLKYAPCIYIIT